MSKKTNVLPMPIGENRQAAIEKMYSEIDQLGQVEGGAANARPEMAVRCVEWAAGGLADVGDSYMLYDRYVQSVEQVSANWGGSKRKRDSDPATSRKANAWKVKQFLKLGGLKIIDPVRLIHRAKAVVKDARLKGTVSLGPYEAMLEIAQAQCANTQHELSDQEMIDVCQPKPKADVEEVDSLGVIRSRLEKHEETYGAHAETTEAKDQIDSLIQSMGGTKAERKARERAEKKAAKKIKRK
jgi:hypothetical protein